ncbi:MAG: hypothetical protein PWP51_1919 [Clostridiales bacterium]|nr:hypothetical protein [Clostridiales bacterium]MDN5299366.1 hypothetical protein [Clostridiales bacterium]
MENQATTTTTTAPVNSMLTLSEYSNLIKPTANYFGAGLNSLTSYLDD